MDISFKATNLELTEALKNYATEKIVSLEKYYAGIVRARVDLERTTKHHHKGGALWCAVANVQAPGHLFRAEAEAEDIYAAIDRLKDELKNELQAAKKKHSALILRQERRSR